MNGGRVDVAPITFTMGLHNLTRAQMWLLPEAHSMAGALDHPVTLRATVRPRDTCGNRLIRSAGARELLRRSLVSPVTKQVEGHDRDEKSDQGPDPEDDSGARPLPAWRAWAGERGHPVAMATTAMSGPIQTVRATGVAMVSSWNPFVERAQGCGELH